MKFCPSEYQSYCIQRVVEQSFIALHLEMGLGKTVVVESALQRLKDDGVLGKVLVIAPKTVAEATWVDEIEKWDHLNLSTAVVMGSERERLNALNTYADLYIINRDNVVWLVKLMGQRKEWPFGTLVIDEATSFKNPSA